MLVANNVGVPVNQVFRYLPDAPLISTPPAPEIGAANRIFSFGVKINFEPLATATADVLEIDPLEA